MTTTMAAVSTTHPPNTPTNQQPTNRPTSQDTHQQTNIPTHNQPHGLSPNQTNQPSNQQTNQQINKPTNRQPTHRPTKQETNSQPTVSQATEPTEQPTDHPMSGDGRRQLRRISLLKAAVFIHDFAKSSTEVVFDILLAELSRRCGRLSSRAIIQGALSQILPPDLEAQHPGGQSSQSIPAYPQALIKVPQ
jgi:hypothetical protein